jgi:hypothetical protein
MSEKDYSEYMKLWMEAGKTFVLNPDANVTCPECKTGTLIIKDEPFGSEKIDRYMICDSCGHHNVMTMVKPD